MSGDAAAREKAYYSFNWATYMCLANGLVHVGPVEATVWFTDGYGDYIRHSWPAWQPSPNGRRGGKSHSQLVLDRAGGLLRGGQSRLPDVRQGLDRGVRLAFTPKRDWPVESHWRRTSGRLMPRPRCCGFTTRIQARSRCWPTDDQTHHFDGLRPVTRWPPHRQPPVRAKSALSFRAMTWARRTVSTPAPFRPTRQGFCARPTSLCRAPGSRKRSDC